jgi:FkbM family methyltransferase
MTQRGETSIRGKAARAYAVLRREGVTSFLDLLRGYFARRIETMVIRRDARRSIAKVRQTADARGLFIDCGSNVGQGFSYFRRYYPARYYDYILIEPNPHCVEELRENVADVEARIEIIDQAASTRADHVKLYGLYEANKGNKTDGASIVREHASALYKADEERAISVKTFSLADLLRGRAGQYASVVMKMDIEGAECDVLEDMVTTGAAALLDAVYVEFHSQYMVEPDRTKYAMRERHIIHRFREMDVPLRTWG